VAEAPRPIAVIVDREGLGDVMLKLPFLRALRRAFPDNPVWWIATHQTSMADDLRPLFERDVARVIAHAGLDGPVRPLLARLRALPPFERVFDARTKISTVALTRFALRHHGFYACLPGYLLCDGRPPSRSRPRHIAARMLSLAAAAAGGGADGSGRLEASPAARALAERLLPAARAYVGIAPGSRQADKNWPMARFCEVAATITRSGVTPVIFLGPQETQAAAEVAAAAPSAIVLRADPEISAGEAFDRLIAQAQRLALLLANDNGVGHLAGAAGTPVVSLFGPTDPARWAPVAPANQILSARDFGGTTMEAIPVAAVVEAVMGLLARTGAAGSDAAGHEVVDVGGAGDGDRDLLVVDLDLAAGDGVVVGQDPDLVGGLGVEGDDRAATHAQQLLHGQDRAAQDH
jgi:ADP-heptose:LPS heptosyltransferase